MTHYDEDALLEYAEGISAEAEAISAHVGACEPCARTLTAQQELIEMLRCGDVWPELPEPTPEATARIAELTSFAGRLDAEEAIASDILDDVFRGPSAWWSTRLMKAAPRLTAGIVREILKRSVGLESTAPQQAHDMTRLAVDIASELSVCDYPSDFVISLRGHALREHAYNLMCLGRFHEAIETSNRAEAAFTQTPLPEYEIARVRLVRAMICQSLERHVEAAELANGSAEIFREFGDVSRYAIARMTQAVLLQRTGRQQEALALWQELQKNDQLDASTRVAITHDLGVCYRENGNLDKAIEHISAAAAEYELLGENVYAAKGRWALAATLVAAGRPNDAVPIFRTTWKQFENLGMEADAALVGLELAEALLLSGQADDVPAICRSVLDRFTRAGMTSRAINALAFLREAVAMGQAQPTLVRHVHDFLRNLPPETSRIALHARLED